MRMRVRTHIYTITSTKDMWSSSNNTYIPLQVPKIWGVNKINAILKGQIYYIENRCWS